QLGIHHREPGVAGFGLLKDNVNVELIVDGFHIVPPMVKLAYRTKGADGIVLITDSMRAKGIPEGESELGGQKVYVKDKQARLENVCFGGSVFICNVTCINMIHFSCCSDEEAMMMSYVNQAKEFNLENKGLLNARKYSDILVLNDEVTVEQTILGGYI